MASTPEAAAGGEAVTVAVAINRTPVSVASIVIASALTHLQRVLAAVEVSIMVLVRPCALLLLAALLASAIAAAAQEPKATRCAAAIVSISPCFAHLAVVAPPARAAAAPTDACCAAFLRAVSSGGEGGGGGGGEGCFCYLFRDPRLLGFPVDTARLSALLPTCASANAAAAATVEAAALFADTCRELKSLPEMRFTPDSPPTPNISPAAVPGSAPPTMEELSTPVPRGRSGSETFSSCRISVVTLILAAAAALITLQF